MDASSAHMMRKHQHQQLLLSSPDSASPLWEAHARLRNPDRVVYGNTGFTKRDLVGFYSGVASLGRRPRASPAHKLGNGFVPDTRREVLESVRPLQMRTSPFADLPEPGTRRGALVREEMKRCVWDRPEVKCEVEFAERTAGRHRHAAFRQLAD